MGKCQSVLDTSIFGDPSQYDYRSHRYVAYVTYDEFTNENGESVGSVELHVTKHGQGIEEDAILLHELLPDDFPNVDEAMIRDLKATARDVMIKKEFAYRKRKDKQRKQTKKTKKTKKSSRKSSDKTAQQEQVSAGSDVEIPISQKVRTTTGKSKKNVVEAAPAAPAAEKTEKTERQEKKKEKKKDKKDKTKSSKKKQSKQQQQQQQQQQPVIISDDSIPLDSIPFDGTSGSILGLPTRTVSNSHKGEGKQKRKYYATIRTTYGDIVVKLYARRCPKTVENFITHARNGYYNGLLFHRVVKGFMIQGGDPNGDGTGGESIYGGEFEDEFHPKLRHTKAFMLSMANSGPNTNGSQFFITTGAAAHLDDKHTLFGKVSAGKEVVRQIENAEVGLYSKPVKDIQIQEIEVIDR